MENNDADKTIDSMHQPSFDERLDKIQQAVSELLAGQKQILSGMNSLRHEVGERYVDLRARIELNNDKLDVIRRELRQFITGRCPVHSTLHNNPNVEDTIIVRNESRVPES